MKTGPYASLRVRSGATEKVGRNLGGPDFLRRNDEFPVIRRGRGIVRQVEQERCEENREAADDEGEADREGGGGLMYVENRIGASTAQSSEVGRVSTRGCVPSSYTIV